MERPLCKLCNHRHYAQEPHIWESKDFKAFVPEPGAVEAEKPKKKRGRPPKTPILVVESAPVAQGIEHRSSKPGVGGSNPPGGTTSQTPVAQPVERRPLESEVEGSNPSGRATDVSSTRKNGENPPISEQNTPEVDNVSTSATPRSIQQMRSRT